MPDVQGFIAQHPIDVSFALVALAFAFWVALRLCARSLRTPLWKFALTRRPAAAMFRDGARLLDLIAAFVLVLAMLAAFFALADGLGVDEGLGRFDDQLADALRQSVTLSALKFFSAVTHLADSEVQTGICIVVAALLLFSRRYPLAVIWVAAVAGNGALNRLLKAISARANRLHEPGWTADHGWSFPSGHASGAVAVYGMLAYLAIRTTQPRWHLPITLGAISIIVLVGCSRVVLQVHYFSDVIAGYASATAWIIVCIAAAEVMRTRRS